MSLASPGLHETLSRYNTTPEKQYLHLHYSNLQKDLHSISHVSTRLLVALSGPSVCLSRVNKQRPHMQRAVFEEGKRNSSKTLHYMTDGGYVSVYQVISFHPHNGLLCPTCNAT